MSSHAPIEDAKLVDRAMAATRSYKGYPKARSDDRFADWLLYAPVVATTIFSKFAVPPFGKLGLGLGFPVVFAALLIALVTGRLEIDAKRATYFAFLVGFAILVQIVHEESFSMLSVVFMATVSLTYVFNIRRPQHGIDDAMRFFANLTMVIAVCGILQFFAQFVVGERYAFPIENLFPKWMVISGFHYLNPLSFGSAVFKANGIYLQEPSFFSQLIAVGIIVEMTAFKRLPRVLTMVLAMVVSYSGTGIVILMICIPVLLIAEQRLDLLAMLLAAALLAIVFGAPLKIDLLLNRISEFDNLQSSASARFVSWIYLSAETLMNDTARMLFGYGAGNFRAVSGAVPYPVAEMMHSKMLIEYGVLGFLAYVGFLVYCIFTSPAPVTVKLAVLVMHFMAGAYAEPVVGVALSLVLLTPRTNQPVAKRALKKPLFPAMPKMRPLRWKQDPVTHGS